MSMPKIVPSNVTKKQAITDIIQSVALEEAAISRILNAEGQKLQRIISFSATTTEELLKANKSVQSMIKSINRLECILLGKLELFEDDFI